MPNWTAITEDHLRATAYGDIVDAARATPVGAIDPVDEAIADATGRVRGALSSALDVDSTKVPNSLRGLTCRMAAFALADLIGLALSTQQEKVRERDDLRLKEIKENKESFEKPDNADGSSEMQRPVSLETQQGGNSGNSREDLRGL